MPQNVAPRTATLGQLRRVLRSLLVQAHDPSQSAEARKTAYTIMVVRLERRSTMLRATYLPDLLLISRANLQLMRCALHPRLHLILLHRLHALRQNLKFPLHMDILDALVKRLSVREGDFLEPKLLQMRQQAFPLAHKILSEIQEKLLESVASLHPLHMVTILEIFARAHTKEEAEKKQAIALPFTRLQLFDKISECLATSAGSAGLVLPQVAAVVRSFTSVLLTPESLFNTLVAHVMGQIMPQLREEDPEKFEKRGPYSEQLTINKEVRHIAKAAAAFGRAANLGRVPLDDVLQSFAEHILHKPGCIDAAKPRDLVDLVEISSAAGNRWGDGSSREDSIICAALALIGRRTLDPDFADVFNPSASWTRKLISSLASGGAHDVVEAWLMRLLQKGCTDHRLIATTTYALVRWTVGEGYRATPSDHLSAVHPSDKAPGEPPNPSPHAEADLHGEGGRGETRVRAVLHTLSAFLLEGRAQLLELPAKHIAYLMFAYARMKCLSVTLSEVLASAFQRHLSEITSESLMPTFQVAHVTWAMASSFAGEKDRRVAGHCLELFDSVFTAIREGRLELSLNHPNATVQILWAATKFSACTSEEADMIARQVTEDGVNRMYAPTVSMGLMSISAVTSPGPAALQLMHHMMRRAKDLTEGAVNEGSTSAMPPLCFDLILYACSRGDWQRTEVVPHMFELSRIAAKRSPPILVSEMGGKSLARVLWSYASREVHHTVLCAAIASHLEDVNVVAAKFSQDPLAVSSALVSLTRLRLKNQKAIGNLCASTARKLGQMQPISLANSLQSVSELGLPGRGLVLASLPHIIRQAEGFTVEQAASTLWHLARCIQTTDDPRASEKVGKCYALLVPRIVAGAADLDVKHIARTLQSLGILGTWSNPDDIECLAESAASRVDDLWWRDLANVLWALGALRHLPKSWLVLQRARKLRKFLPKDMVRVAVWDASVEQHATVPPDLTPLPSYDTD